MTPSKNQPQAQPEIAFAKVIDLPIYLPVWVDEHKAQLRYVLGKNNFQKHWYMTSLALSVRLQMHRSGIINPQLTDRHCDAPCCKPSNLLLLVPRIIHHLMQRTEAWPDRGGQCLSAANHGWTKVSERR